ncbi:hypothetical protein M3231_03545 [Neobacillus mesonae]|nr:hypothetical protein [Neobacillus mesonae]
MAFGQHIFQVGAAEVSNSPAACSEVRVVERDVNTGVHSRSFSIMFSKQAGTLIFVNSGGSDDG